MPRQIYHDLINLNSSTLFFGVKRGWPKKDLSDAKVTTIRVYYYGACSRQHSSCLCNYHKLVRSMHIKNKLSVAEINSLKVQC